MLKKFEAWLAAHSQHAIIAAGALALVFAISAGVWFSKRHVSAIPAADVAAAPALSRPSPRVDWVPTGSWTAPEDELSSIAPALAVEEIAAALAEPAPAVPPAAKKPKPAAKKRTPIEAACYQVFGPVVPCRF